MGKRREKVVYRQHKGDGLKRDETRVLSGIVYMMNRNGPRTEPRGTPHENIREEEKELLHLTRKD